MIDEFEYTREEFRALVFFVMVGQCIDNGEKWKEYARQLLPFDKAALVPQDIIKEIGSRLRASETGVTSYGWIDRAVPGYKATLENMLELRKMTRHEFENDDKEKTLWDIL